MATAAPDSIADILDIRPLQPTIGAEIHGVDIAKPINPHKRPEFQVRFSWQPGSVAFWDNRAAVHYAVRNYGDYPRLLHRVLIADEPLYADL